MDRMAFHDEGGVFGGFFSQDTMRSMAYKYSGIHSIRNRCSERPLNLLIVMRSRGRNWIKVTRYEKMIQKSWRDVDIK